MVITFGTLIPFLKNTFSWL